MAVLPLLRVTFFFLITLSSLGVLAVCAHIDYITAGYATVSLSFVPFGIAASCLTILSLPVFLALGHLPYRVFTSTILFEVIWLFGLWILWVGTAADTVVGKANRFPAGCVYDQFPTANGICYEWTALEAFAFFNFVCAFVYSDVILSYAIVNSIRGRNIWTSSVEEAVVDAPKTVHDDISMVPAQSSTAPATQHQGYGAYPSELGPTKPQSVQVSSLPYNAYPKQVAPGLPPQYSSAYPQRVPRGLPAQQYNAYPPQASPQRPPPQQHIAYPQRASTQRPLSQHYNVYSQQAPPQKLPPQQYNAYLQQASPQGSPMIQADLKRVYSSPGSPRQRASYVGHPSNPTSSDFPLPPQQSHNTYPIVCSPPMSPPLNGYPSPLVPQSRPYSTHLPIVM